MLWVILRHTVFQFFKICLVNPLYGGSESLKYYHKNLQFKIIQLDYKNGGGDGDRGGGCGGGGGCAVVVVSEVIIGGCVMNGTDPILFIVQV